MYIYIYNRYNSFIWFHLRLCTWNTSLHSLHESNPQNPPLRLHTGGTPATAQHLSDQKGTEHPVTALTGPCFGCKDMASKGYTHKNSLVLWKIVAGRQAFPFEMVPFQETFVHFLGGSTSKIKKATNWMMTRTTSSTLIIPLLKSRSIHITKRKKPGHGFKMDDFRPNEPTTKMNITVMNHEILIGEELLDFPCHNRERSQARFLTPP